jgi:lipopolysaccharide export system permease protein
MRILDKYILKETIMTFIFGICAFSAVFLGSGTLLRIAQYITQYGASFSAIVRLIIYSLPGIIVWTFPMSMLLAALLTFGRLSGNSEIIAMKACGVSFKRLVTPVIAFSLGVSIFSIGFNEYVVPASNQAYTDLVRYEIQGNTSPESQEHIIIKQIQDGNIQRLVYARKYDAETGNLDNLSIQEFEQGKMVRVENAEYAKWSVDEWVMYNGVLYDLSQPNTERMMKFDSQVLPINQTPKQIIKSQKKPDEMTIKELREQINIMKSQYVDTKKLEIELYQRFTVPMASLMFALIGAPLGIQPNRSSSSIGFGISIIIIFIYYTLMTLAGAIGQNSFIPPVIAVWIPNIVTLIAGIYLIRKESK